jgi:ligand-binding sensor domain-containing protein
MWFGTPDGLCRYDGRVLTSYRYKPVNEHEPMNNFVRLHIAEDKKGNIWYCNESGIYYWNALKRKIVLERVFKKEEFGNSHFNGIELDNQGNLWMLNVNEGIARYSIASKEFIIFPLPISYKSAPVQYTFSATDNEQNIWIRLVTVNNPFLKFNKTSCTYTTEFESNPPHAIFFDKENKILAYDDRLVIIKKDKSTIIIPKTVRGKKVDFFSFNGLIDSYDRIWMTARSNGLFYFDKNEKLFFEFHHDNSKLKSLPFDLTTCLYVDRSDNLWIGIDGGGVSKIDLKQPKFNLFPLSEGDHPILKDYFTKCMYEDEMGRIWFGSHHNGLSIYNPVTVELINYKNIPGNKTSLPANGVASIHQDSKGNMWIGTNAGICIFNESKKSFRKIEIENLPVIYPGRNLFVYKFLELKNGDFIITTLIGPIIIKKIKPGEFKGRYFGNKQFLRGTTTDVAEMDDGSLFISSPASGLFHIRESAQGFDSINTFFAGIDLRSIRRDEKSKDVLWISSGKGLIRFNTITQKYKVWNTSNGLANGYIYGSLEDEKNNLWISTNGGLSYLDVNTNQVSNYSYQDGLQSNEFNTQAFYKSKTNTFYFGGIKGFNWFKSQTFATSAHKPQVSITTVEVDDEVCMDSGLLHHAKLFLPYNRNDLNFQFAALDYTRPEANRI